MAAASSLAGPLATIVLRVNQTVITNNSGGLLLRSAFLLPGSVNWKRLAQMRITFAGQFLLPGFVEGKQLTLMRIAFAVRFFYCRGL